jgi:hypothetical protein
MASRMYVCGRCEEAHKDEDDAAQCCPPEVWEAWACDSCGKEHGMEQAADSCCPGNVDHTRCPVCFRDYHPRDLDATCIQVVGHCQKCTPFFTYDQQHQIEDLHWQKTGDPKRVNA